MNKSKRPNIIVITCDQLRAFELGCYGNPVIRTPNVDRLAAEGCRFETAVTNFPVCMAARSVLISGQYNRTCTGGISNVTFPGMAGDHNMPEYPFAGRPHLKDTTLPEILRDNGYRTSAIGKWHIHSWPHDVGFDQYVIPRVHHCHTGQSFTENGGPEFIAPGYSVDYEAGRVEQLIREQQNKPEPFFLYYNIPVPHCPLADAPEKYRSMYRPEEVPLRPNVNPDQRLDNQEHWFKVYRHDFRYYHLHLPYAEVLPQDYTLRHLIAEYYGMTSWMDTMVGRVLASLDAAGLTENTIVVFTSDHGDNLGSHALVQKNSPNEEAVRIPLIIRWPGGGSRAAVIRRHVGSLVDLAPTLLSLIDLAPPAHFQGRNLAGLCRGLQCDAEDYAIVETSAGAAIRTPTEMVFFPFAENSRILKEQPAQHYDMNRDPYQLQNLATDTADNAKRERLDSALRTWDAQTPWMKT